MKKTIAVSIQKKEGLQSPLDPRFGRASCFLLVEEGEEEFRYLENAAQQQAHGAGIQAAANMAQAGVQAVISGQFGPKAYQALAASQIEMWMAPPNIAAGEALEQLEAGSLQPMKYKVY